MTKRHMLTITERRASVQDVFKAYCDCGWQSKRSTDKREVVHLYREHMRHVERQKE